MFAILCNVDRETNGWKEKSNLIVSQDSILMVLLKCNFLLSKFNEIFIKYNLLYGNRIS